MLTAVVSDLHLGTRMSVLGTPPIRDGLLEQVAAADQVVLLGDVLSLREAPAAEVLQAARPFLDRLREAAGNARVVLVPGNHDHRLADAVLEPRRLQGVADPLGLEQLADPKGAPLAAAIARALGDRELVIAYPGLWIRPDVYATHGHYLDCHMSVPRLESLCAAAMEAAVGDVPDAGAGPDDYEAVLAPLYAFAHARAQSPRAPGRSSPSRAARLVRRVQRAGWARVLDDGRATPVRTRALDGLAALLALEAVNRSGLGPFRSDLSPAAIGRAGVGAAAELVTRLAVEARYVIYGHTHRAGPLPGDDGWTLPGGPGLVNGGSWVYEPALIGSAGPADPYWPGRCVLVGDDGPPELRLVLEEPAATRAIA